MGSTTVTGYSIPQKALHWTMALLILFNLIFSDGMEHWNRLMRRGEPITPDDISSANIHAYVGIAVLVLCLVRLCLRLVQGVPEAPADEPPIAKLVAKVTHWAFYAIFILMPMSGIGKYYFGNDIAGELHGGPIKLLLWALIVLHILGVLVHQFFWRTNLLRRMA
ncbi:MULTISPECIES: cytochrome b [Rhizobium/Agrobacterium group]|uniref:Cytochrome B n=1 Tax=Rhizobium rhizogenes TaxID=359 RepID=A0AA92C2F0_RHIRH|nr:MULTISPECIES: cytochrome b/b6 domain-containing protein [Rhizobium/Agrobacterium group]MDD1499919.1 cytochrome b/b6 domain-containing protein [Agrobacterium sp. CNPSo 3708]PVE53231.1 cytochrome B [Rhizobium rhizogenes]PVE63338.1 cytochrome B [Agrobacterium tumefaciens]PVE72229.1 cytochrome B [Sphingomonas sp. TPD3009]